MTAITFDTLQKADIRILETKIDALEIKMETKIDALANDIHSLRWMLGIIVVLTVVPLIKDLI